MFIIIWITFGVLFVAVLAAHVWAANVIVERLWPKEDMAKQLKPAGVPSAAGGSIAARPAARLRPAPMAGPSTEAPRARPCLRPPTQTDDPVAQLGPEYPAVALLGKHGGDRKSRSYKAENQACNDVSLKHGTVEHWKARLRRDDPALAARVDRGELSANAAATQKGWRKPRKVRLVRTEPLAAA
jgi:hypothetical protein